MADEWNRNEKGAAAIGHRALDKRMFVIDERQYTRFFGLM